MKKALLSLALMFVTVPAVAGEESNFTAQEKAEMVCEIAADQWMDSEQGLNADDIHGMYLACLTVVTGEK